MKIKKKYLSIIIPVYNEKERLENIPKVLEYLEKKSFSYELLIVNDGSDKKLTNYLKKRINGINIRYLGYEYNKGKGYALKVGFLAATGTWRLFTDVDLSTPLSTIDIFLKDPDNNFVTIGSRKASGSDIIVHQPILREMMGRVFTKLSQLILGISVSDFTCGFKLFHKDAAEKIFSSSRINRWGFDPEILFLAKKYNYSIKEIPVSWKNDSRSRVKFPQDVVRSFSELIAIRINDLLHRY